MNKLLFIYIFCPFFLVAQDNPELKKVLDKVIRYDTEINKKKVPGFIIGVIEQDSTYIFPYGEIKRGTGIAPDRNTLFEIGSATKVYTMSLLNVLIGQNKLQLEDPIHQYLPDEYHNEQGDSIRIQDLVSHSSGLPVYPIGFGAKQSSARNPFSDYSKEDVLDFYKSYDLTEIEEEPIRRNRWKKKRETPYKYSHVNFALLEIILENATQTPFASLLQKELLEPLNLSNTYLEMTDELSARLAQGHSIGRIEVEPWTFNSFAASNGIKTNLADILQFIRIQMGDHHQGLSTLFQANFIPRHESALTKRISVGNAWHIIHQKKYHDVIGHPGATDGHRLEMHFIPETRTGVVILSNSEYHMDNLGLIIMGILNNHWKLQ